MTQIEFRDLPYIPRWYQQEFEDAMFGGKRRAFLLYHRRCGKDLECWNFMINCALIDRPALYYYILPKYTHGKKVIWDGIDESGNRFLDYIPKESLASPPNSTEMKIKLDSGSIIQVVGSLDYDSLRGTNPYGVVFSEFAMQAPQVWDEVISPILLKNGGWAVFNTTPMGKNRAYHLWNFAQKEDDWYTQKLTVDDTGLITKEQIEKERHDGKSEEIIQQEYYCSFIRGIEGSYYGKLINIARDEKRICNVPHSPISIVNCSFDLGIDDSTAIWWWQQIGQEIHFIDYYEMNGEPLSHYVKILKDKPYIYGDVWLPHDARVRELGTGMSRYQMFRQLGVDARIVPNIHLMDGIEIVRGMLHKCWFDKKKCEKGISALEMYHKEYNAKYEVYSQRPIHDSSSHGSDSMRYSCIAIAKGMNKGDGSEMGKMNKELRATV